MNKSKTNTEKMKNVLALNELNFDLIKKYIKAGYLPNFKRLLKNEGLIITESENENRLLEPWIQWVSVYSGLKYHSHKVFRLGDINELNFKLIFDELDESSINQLLVSPFNCPNNLKNSDSVFISDPWTNTKSTASKRHLKLIKVLIKAINNNAGGGRLKLQDLLTLGINSIRELKLTDFKLLLKIYKSKSFKAAFLDLLIFRVYYNSKSAKFDFGWLFLNGAAHIQHHYYNNSKVVESKIKNPDWYINKEDDCILNIYSVYDHILKDYFNFDEDFIVLTGLSQKLHKNQTFYYRLSNHAQLLNKINLKYSKVLPRMSRDFLIEFDNQQDCDLAFKILDNINFDSRKLFHMDIRDKSLFVELIYSKEIMKNSFTLFNNVSLDIFEFVDFVAIKNGEHSKVGYLASNFKTDLNEEIQLEETNAFMKSWVINSKL